MRKLRIVLFVVIAFTAACGGGDDQSRDTAEAPLSDAF